MKIAVFIKPIPDILTIKTNKDGKIEKIVKKKINETDLNALEEAIKLIKIYKGEVFAFLIGNKEDIIFLKEALARGANKAILISDPIFSNVDEISKAKIIVAALKKAGYFDLIMFGETSNDTMQNQLGILVADKLNLPHIAYAKKIWIEESKVVCEKRYEEEIYVNEVRMPAVITVTIDLNIPKEISQEKIEKLKVEPKVWDSKFLGIKPEILTQKIRILETKKIMRKSMNKVITYKSYSEAAEKLSEIIINNIFK